MSHFTYMETALKWEFNLFNLFNQPIGTCIYSASYLRTPFQFQDLVSSSENLLMDGLTVITKTWPVCGDREPLGRFWLHTFSMGENGYCHL